MIVEFEGKEYEFPDDASIDEIDSVLKELSPPKEKKKTGFFEDIGIGLESAGHSTADALQLIAGGVVGNLGYEEERDKIFDAMVARNKARDEELAQLDQGLGGKITSGVAQAVPMLLGGGTGALAAGLRGTAAIKTAATVPSAINALSQSQRNVQEGASAGQAILQAPVEGAIDYASMMLPVGKGIAKGAAWGAGGNVVGQAGVDLAGNIIQNEDVARKNYSMDLTNPEVREKYLVAGGVGGVMGGATGPLNRAPGELKATDVQRDGDTRKLGKDVILPDEAKENQKVIDRNTAQIKRDLGFIKDAEDRIQELTDKIAKAEGWLSKTPEDAQKVQDQINRYIESIKQEQKNIDQYRTEIAEREANTRARKGITEPEVAPKQVEEPLVLDPVDPALRGRGGNGEPSAPYTKTPLPEGGQGSPKRYEINSKHNADWAKQQPDDVLNRELDRKLNLLAKYQRDPDQTRGPRGPENELRDRMLVEEIRIIQNELDSRSGNQADSQRLTGAEEGADTTPTTPDNAARIAGLEENIAALERFLATKQGNKEARDMVARELAETKAELESLQPNRMTTHQDDVGAAPDNVIADVVREAAADPENKTPLAVRFLESVAQKAEYPWLQQFARNMLDNPNIKPWIAIMNSEYVGHAKEAADSLGLWYQQKYGMVLGKLGLNQLTFMHEMTHSVTAAAIDAARKVRDGGWLVKDKKGQPINATFSKEQMRAAHGILDLYDLMKKKGKIPFDKITDADEFAAYGVIDPKVRDYYANVRYGGITVADKIKQLWKLITRQQETVLDVLDRHVKESIGADQGKKEADYYPSYTKDLTDAADAAVQQLTSPLPSKGPVNVGGVYFKRTDNSRIDFATRITGLLDTLTKAKDQIKDLPALKFSKNYFGIQQFLEQLPSHPLTDHVGNAVMDALETQARLARNWVGGPIKKAITGSTKHAVATIQHMQDAMAPLLLLRASTNADVAAVRDRFLDNFNKGIKHTDNLTGLSATQQRLAKGLADLFDQMRRDVNEDRAKRGMPPITQRDGWLPSVRVGDFIVFVKDKYGDVVHVERFRSEYQAQNFVNRLPKWASADRIIDSQSKLSDADIQQLRAEFGDEFGVRDQMDVKDLGRSAYAQKTAHDLFRTGASGYLGAQWFKSEKQSVNDFRRNILKGIDEYANAHKRAIINHETSIIMNNMKNLSPQENGHVRNAYSIAESLIKSATGGHQPKMMNRFFQNAIDDTLIRTLQNTPLKDWSPQVPIVDRVHGLAAQLFYLQALTSRPGFWFAQLLSTPQSFRHLFRDGSTLESTVAMGRGLLTAFSGGDQNFRDAVMWVANNKDTFHPQFINEINELPQIGGSKLRTLVEWGTGQKISSGADSLSRYATFAVMYKFYEAKGLRGKELWKRAADATDTTMVQYNMPYKSPLIQRLGIIGQGVSPLLTFATAQQGLLMADFKLAARTGNVKPLIATALTAAAMGGAIGIPFVLEYEFLNELLGLGLPSIKEYLLSKDNKKEDVLGMDAQTVLLGGPTAAANAGAQALGMSEGLDIGSGLRWNQIISRQITGDGSAMDMFPAVKAAIDMAKASAVIAKKNAGEPVEENEYRKALHKISFFVGQKAAFDMSVGYDERRFNAQGPASRASKETTDADVISSAIGSQSISARKEALRQEIIMKSTKKANETIKKNTTLIYEAIRRGDTKLVSELINENYKLDPTWNAESALTSHVKGRELPRWMFDIMNKNPNRPIQRLELGQ